jgi:DNA-binding response OmpR family regulator
MAKIVLETGEIQTDETVYRASPRALHDTRHEESVLLIEDSEDAMLLVRYALNEYGDGRFKLEWESCLQDGLARIAQGGTDVILLDLGLPECSGATSYAKVREAAPHLPVVVLTGDTREETELSVFSGGVEDYLVKDQVSGSLLITVLDEALRKNRRQHPKNMSHHISKRFHWRAKA